jgi:hypothetical protein
MSETIAGGCACGAIRYETDVTPVVMFNCHCRDCQRASGSGYAAILVFPKATVRVHGEPRYYKTVGNAGQAVERGFCAVCGSPVMSKLERKPDMLALSATSLDDPSLYKPAMDVFTDSAWHWDAMTVDTQKLPKDIAG